ncbi:hypothetical protein NKH77_05360 [Streptomyces sp. M19]
MAEQAELVTAQLPALDAADRALIAGGTAARLYGSPPAPPAPAPGDPVVRVRPAPAAAVAAPC